jgi:hypothetical protein
MDRYIDITLTMDVCKTKGCQNLPFLHGHFHNEKDIDYCGSCIRKRENARRHCGVCRNDLTDECAYGNTCEEHIGMTLRKCANPDCETGKFYRNRKCVCILQFVDLPCPKYSYRGDDYCDVCLPVISKMNERYRLERIKFQRAVKVRNSRFQKIAEEEKSRTALLEHIKQLDIKALRRSLYEEEEDYKPPATKAYGVYPRDVVEIERTLVVKVKTKHYLSHSLKQSDIDHATGKVKLNALPDSLKGDYAGDEIPHELIVCQSVSNAKVSFDN